MNKHYYGVIKKYGRDILKSHGMNDSKTYVQHGDTSVYKHCLSVADMSLKLAKGLHIDYNEETLVRGALLHDYFLYDWHVFDKSHRLHGFFHAEKALKNAERDFELNDVERDMIWTHMFPMNITRIPKHRESVILCVADKIVSTREVFKRTKHDKKTRSGR